MTREPIPARDQFSILNKLSRTPVVLALDSGDALPRVVGVFALGESQQSDYSSAWNAWLDVEREQPAIQGSSVVDATAQLGRKKPTRALSMREHQKAPTHVELYEGLGRRAHVDLVRPQPFDERFTRIARRILQAQYVAVSERDAQVAAAVAATRAAKRDPSFGKPRCQLQPPRHGRRIAESKPRNATSRPLSRSARCSFGRLANSEPRILCCCSYFEYAP